MLEASSIVLIKACCTDEEHVLNGGYLLRHYAQPMGR